MAARTTTGGVRTPYTEEMVQAYLLDLKQLGMSLREIAYVIYGGKLTHGVIQRAMNGEFPKDNMKRAALGLSPLVPAPACPDCGKPHTIDGVCTQGKAVTVTVVDEPGEMVIRRRAPRKPKPAPPVWEGVEFHFRRRGDWGPQPGPVVDLDPRAEAIRLALAVLGGHGWTDEQLARAGVALAGVQQERDG